MANRKERMTEKPKRTRVGHTTYKGLTFTEPQLAALDEWARIHGLGGNRSEANRQMIAVAAAVCAGTWQAYHHASHNSSDGLAQANAGNAGTAY